MRHPRVGHRVDHQRPVPDDAALLVRGADHVAGRVLQEDQRRVGLVRQLDELRRLLRLLAEEHAARVGQDADRVAVDRRPAGDQRRPVRRLELVEAGAVDDPGQHLARVERHPQVGAGDAEQVLRVVHAARPAARSGRGRLAPVAAGTTICRPIRSASSSSSARWSARPLTAGVHLGAAERLVVGVLAGRHLHQRRAAEEDLRPLPHHHHVVAHPGHVRAAGGGVAEDQRDGRDAGGGQPGQVAEDPPARDEDLRLAGQVGAARLDQARPAAAGSPRRCRAPGRLLHRPRVARAAADRRVVRGDHALDARRPRRCR